MDGLFETAQDAEKFIKEEFQKMYANKAEEIFNANPLLFAGKQWNGITINSWQDLQALATNDPNFWQSEFFSFIKVK